MARATVIEASAGTSVKRAMISLPTSCSKRRGRRLDRQPRPGPNEGFGRERRGDRVPPEIAFGQVVLGQRGLEPGAHVDAQGQREDRSGAEANHGVVHSGDLGARRAPRGVRPAQQGCGEGRVVADDIDDLGEINAFAGRENGEARHARRERLETIRGAGDDLDVQHPNGDRRPGHRPQAVQRRSEATRPAWPR